MKTAEHWANLIQNDLTDAQSLSEESRFLIGMVRQIQSDALQTEGPSDVELLYHYHSQQKEWWRTNTNDPHNIGTALYAMHCDMVNFYDALTSGDARRNFEHNKRISNEPVLSHPPSKIV